MKDQVYDLIKERIFDGYYKTGEEIRILPLSQELGISNTPIREALTMLTAEGLLTTSLNNKFRVIELSEELMIELNETILLLLLGGYYFAHKDGRDRDLEEMLQMRYRDQLIARESGNQDEYIRKTLLFDRSFVEITGNKKLLSIFDANNYLLYLYVRYTYWKEKNNQEKKLREHLALIDAVRIGEYEQVRRLLEEHYDEHYEEVLC